MGQDVQAVEVITHDLQTVEQLLHKLVALLK